MMRKALRQLTNKEGPVWLSFSVADTNPGVSYVIQAPVDRLMSEAKPYGSANIDQYQTEQDLNLKAYRVRRSLANSGHFPVSMPFAIVQYTMENDEISGAYYSMTRGSAHLASELRAAGVTVVPVIAITHLESIAAQLSLFLNGVGEIESVEGWSREASDACVLESNDSNAKWSAGIPIGDLLSLVDSRTGIYEYNTAIEAKRHGKAAGAFKNSRLEGAAKNLALWPQCQDLAEELAISGGLGIQSGKFWETEHLLTSIENAFAHIDYAEAEKPAAIVDRFALCLERIEVRKTRSQYISANATERLKLEAARLAIGIMGSAEAMEQAANMLNPGRFAELQRYRTMKNLVLLREPGLGLRG